MVYGATRIFGTGALGPVVVALSVVALIVAAFGRRSQERHPIPAAET